MACKSIIGHDSRPKNRAKFEATIQGADLAGLDVIVFENSPMDVARSPRNIARAPDDCLLLCQQLAGKAGFEDNSRNVLLMAGDIVLLDPRRPYAGQFASGSKMLVLRIPRRVLEARLGFAREVTVRKVERNHHICALTLEHLAMLPCHVGEIGSTAAATVREYTLDLIAQCLGTGTDGAKPARSAARSIAASNVKASIELRLTDPVLSPSSIASGAGVSVRYANALLAEEGSSILRLVQARRLERCRKALGDPSQIHRTVGEIAFGWGFSDLTHFGRSFKKRFGMPPREYRRQCLAVEV